MKTEAGLEPRRTAGGAGGVRGTGSRERRGSVLSYRVWREHDAAHTSVLDAVPRSWQRIVSCCFQLPGKRAAVSAAPRNGRGREWERRPLWSPPVPSLSGAPGGRAS